LMSVRMPCLFERE